MDSKPPIWFRVREFLEDIIDWLEWRFGTTAAFLGNLLSQPIQWLASLMEALARWTAKPESDDIENPKVVDAEGGFGDRISQGIEFLEWTFFGLMRVLDFLFVSPFRWLLSTRMAQSTQQVQAQLAAGTAGKLTEAGEGVADIVDRFAILRLFEPLLNVFSVCFDFINTWFRTRDFRKLFWALPALLLSAPLVGALVMGALYSPVEKIRHYELARLEALEEEDDLRANFLLMRLKQLGFRREDEAEFQLAMDLVEQENVEAATAKLRQLAPLSEPKFAPAHLWLAAAYLDGTLTASDPWHRIKTHALNAKQLEPKNLLAQRFLLECLLHEGKVQEAIVEMESLRLDFPDLNAELAYHYRTLGKTVEAKQCSSDAVRHFEKTQREQDTTFELTPKGYARIAEAYGMLRQFEKGLEVLTLGVKLYPESDQIRQLLISQLVGGLLADNQLKQQKDDYLRRLLLLEPTNKIAVQRVLQLVQSASTEEQKAKNDKFFSTLAAEKNAPPKLLVTLGDIYLYIERYDHAKPMYEKACQLDAKQGTAWNNLAWIVSHIEPINLNLASQYSQKAVEANPSMGDFYDTQGQILALQERWDEAIKAFRQALNGTVGSPTDTYAALAECFEALGQAEQAAAYRAMIQDES